jgi:hypothetical protein
VPKYAHLESFVGRQAAEAVSRFILKALKTRAEA